MIKSLLRRYIGSQAWAKLADVRQEFRIRNQIVHMDHDLFAVVGPMLPVGGYYVDIGAHDGRSYSNTYHLEKAGWKGLLVEPILPTYFRLRQLRSLESNHLVNAACVAFDYSSPHVLMSYGDLMSIAPEISTLDAADWVSGSEKFLNRNETVTKTWAPAKTLNQILMEVNSPENISFLSIDVEGAELEVLKGVNFDYFNFDLICLETYTPEILLEFMSTKGYFAITYVAHNLVLQKKLES